MNDIDYPPAVTDEEFERMLNDGTADEYLVKRYEGLTDILFKEMLRQFRAMELARSDDLI